MQKGINQSCYPPGTSLELVFSWSKKAGLDVVELNLGDSDNIGLTMETTKEEAKEIQKKAGEAGITLKSLSTTLLWKTPLSSAEVSVREEGMRVVQKMLELSDAMELDTILVVPGIVTPEISYDICYERSQTAIKELSKEAGKRGVRIGIENVWNRFLLSPMEMASFIDGCESDYVGAYFDVGNVMQFGFPEQWIRILNHRIFKVHFKDFKVSTGNITGFVPLLAGDVNWKEVATALRKVGYNDSVVAELSPYTIDASAIAADTSNQMDSILLTQ